MQMQEFDLDEYMEGGIEGSETLNFDLDNNAPCGPRFLEPNYYLAASSAQIPLSYQLGNLQPSVGIESHTLVPYAHTAASSTTDVGAGSFPHSHGTQLATGSGNPVTDFTKRRNWARRVIEELRDFLYILSPDGRLLYVSPSVTSLTGYAPQDVVGKLISDYIHHDDANLFGREFNESIASGKPLRFFYRFRKKDGTYAIFEAHGHPHFTSEAAPLGQNAGASFCCGFFMMSRPYPTKNAALLDSFLEHKIENERLRKRIADLRREEQEDLEDQQQQWLDRRGSESTVHSQSAYPQIQHEDARASRDYDGMPPPKKPSVANNALTRQNLDEALAKSDPDSIDDKMARYERPHHFETIEMLTGLRYRDGERSKGISTGAASPTLTHGNEGFAMQSEEDGRYRQGFEGYEDHSHGDIHCSDKRRKMKVADEHVCTDCGTLDSPEWRKGPTGPKTLCNACGLRWAKKEKKRIGPSIEVAPNQGNAESSAPPAGAKRTMPPETT